VVRAVPASMKISEKGAWSASVVQSACRTSMSSCSNISITPWASSGSSSAVITRVALGAPLRNQAAPTPQPVPHSAMVPVRVAARVASSRPVSLREVWT
jgi:hypothetical protein